MKKKRYFNKDTRQAVELALICIAIGLMLGAMVSLCIYIKLEGIRIDGDNSPSVVETESGGTITISSQNE